MNRFSLLPSGSYLGTRQALLDSIAADERSAAVAATREQREHFARGADMGRRALARHDAVAARKDAPSSEPVSGIRRNPTLVGVAPPAVRSAPTPSAIVPPHPTTYSFVRRAR